MKCGKEIEPTLFAEKMDNFCIIHKAIDGSYSIDGDNRPIDLKLLVEKYPHTRFILRNDTNTFGYENVFTKSDIIKACGMDEKLQVKCPECSTKNRYNRAVCRKCDESIPYHDILMNTFGENYSKAVIDYEVEMQFGRLSNKRFGKSSFEPYETSRAVDDFLKTLSAAFFRS